MIDWIGFWMIAGVIGGILALIAGAIGATWQYFKGRREVQ